MIRTTIMCLIGGMLLVAACGAGTGPTQEQEDCYAQSISTARVATLKQAELWDNEIDDVTALATIMEGEALLAEDGETFTAWLLDRFPDTDEAKTSELIAVADCFGSDRVGEWVNAAPPTSEPPPQPTTTTSPCESYTDRTVDLVEELEAIISAGAVVADDIAGRADDLAEDMSLRQRLAEDLEPLAERALRLRSDVEGLPEADIGAHTFLLRATSNEVQQLELTLAALDETDLTEIAASMKVASRYAEYVDSHLADYVNSLADGCSGPITTTTSSTTTLMPATTAACFRDIWYFVEGTTKLASNVTLTNAFGNTEQGANKLVPLTIEGQDEEGFHVGVMPCGAFVYISAQNGERSGSIECRIEADGVTIEHAISDGAYVVAACSGSVR